MSPGTPRCGECADPAPGPPWFRPQAFLGASQEIPDPHPTRSPRGLTSPAGAAVQLLACPSSTSTGLGSNLSPPGGETALLGGASETPQPPPGFSDGLCHLLPFSRTLIRLNRWERPIEGARRAGAGVPVAAGVPVMGQAGCVAEKFWTLRRGIRDAMGEGCLEKVTFKSGPEEQGVHNQGQVQRLEVRRI